jgi:hypothetical protein
MSTEEKRTCICPYCKRKQTFKADEWPDDCGCYESRMAKEE